MTTAWKNAKRVISFSYIYDNSMNAYKTSILLLLYHNHSMKTWKTSAISFCNIYDHSMKAYKTSILLLLCELISMNTVWKHVKRTISFSYIYNNSM